MSSNNEADVFWDKFDISTLNAYLDAILKETNNNKANHDDDDLCNVPSSPTSQSVTSNLFTYLPLFENIPDDDSSLEEKPLYYPSNIEQWEDTHIMKWILELYDKQNYRYEDLNIHIFKNKTGSCLKDLEESAWNKIDNRRGSWLYKEVQCLIKDLKYKSISTSDCGSQPSDELTQSNVQRKRGRPPKSNSKPRNKEKVGRIWEFLRDLLKDPECCPRYIRWDNYDKLEFRLVDPRKICEIWGHKKGREISYEHFSRSIRHYYNLSKDNPDSTKAKILSVPDRRLVYKFNKDALEPEDFKQFINCTESNVHT